MPSENSSAVGELVKTYGDHVSEIIERLSNTLLAAVGVLLGSFIASLFRTEFNATIFSTGMWVYAVYVLFIPLLYNMSHQWGRYKRLKVNFKHRRRRFEEQLSRERVNAIIGDEVWVSEGRFEDWYWNTILIYFLLILTLAWAGNNLPGIIALSP